MHSFANYHCRMYVLLIKKYLSGFRNVLSLLYIAARRDWRYCLDAADINGYNGSFKGTVTKNKGFWPSNRGQHPATHSQWNGSRERLHQPGFLLRFGTFSPIKYRGNRPSTFSHQPILGLLFSWNFRFSHGNFGQCWWLGQLDTMFFHIFSDIFCIVLRPNDTSQLPESLLSVPLVLPPRSSGCQGWSPGWSACGASTDGAGLPPPNSHLVSSKNAGKTTNFTSMV